MPTQVKLNPHFFGIQPLHDENFFPITEFFCKEEPKEVLEKIARDYFIADYKSIYLPRRTFVKKENCRFLYDLQIMNAPSPNGFTISGNLADFETDLSFYKSHEIPDYLKSRKNELLGDLITRKLVFVYANSDFPRQTPKVQSVENYLLTRKSAENPEMEIRLQDILELSSVFLHKDIKIDDLEKVKLKLPKIGQPYRYLPGLNC